MVTRRAQPGEKVPKPATPAAKKARAENRTAETLTKTIAQVPEARGGKGQTR